MHQHDNGAHNPARVLFLCVLSFAILMGSAAAKQQPKTYPEEGKIIGTGTTEHTHTSGSIFGGPGGPTTGSIGSRSKYTHTYKVQTSTKVFELDCGQEAVFHSTGKECGGEKPLQVGDVIHFRIEKEWVYIPITEKVANDDFDQTRGTHEKQTEEKLRILSEVDATSEKAAAPAPQVQPAAESNVTKVSIASTPAGADIEVDGGFVGNTPSTIDVAPGDHTITVSKNGFTKWERKLKASGGNVNLNAELETQAK